MRVRSTDLLLTLAKNAFALPNREIRCLDFSSTNLMRFFGGCLNCRGGGGTGLQQSCKMQNCSGRAKRLHRSDSARLNSAAERMMQPCLKVLAPQKTNSCFPPFQIPITPRVTRTTPQQCVVHQLKFASVIAIARRDRAKGIPNHPACI